MGIGVCRPRRGYNLPREGQDGRRARVVQLRVEEYTLTEGPRMPFRVVRYRNRSLRPRGHRLSVVCRHGTAARTPHTGYDQGRTSLVAPAEGIALGSAVLLERLRRHRSPLEGHGLAPLGHRRVGKAVETAARDRMPLSLRGHPRHKHQGRARRQNQTAYESVKHCPAISSIRASRCRWHPCVR